MGRVLEVEVGYVEEIHSLKLVSTYDLTGDHNIDLFEQGIMINIPYYTS